MQLHSSAGWILLHEPLIEEISEGKFIVLAKRLPVQPGPLHGFSLFGEANMPPGAVNPSVIFCTRCQLYIHRT